MLVQDLMRKQVFTVAPDDSVDRVFFLIHYEKIRHLPVLERSKVVGIVSDRDMYKALGPKSRRRGVSENDDGTQLQVVPRKVRQIMRRGVVTIEPDEDAVAAARKMARKRIGGLPVVRGDRLVGIITATDILETFAKLCAGVPAP